MPQRSGAVALPPGALYRRIYLAAEAHVFWVTVIIVVVAGTFIGLLIRHVQQENAPGDRPTMRSARRAMRKSRILASGDLCLCGGALGDTGKTSPKFGALLGCTNCNRSWTMDGRWVVRRRRPRTASRRVPEPATESENDLRRARRLIDRPAKP